MMHPIQWPDIIVGVILAELFLLSVRNALHRWSQRNAQLQVVDRMRNLQPAALDPYRYAQKRSVNEPLG